jgi:hypothetical protein
VYPNEKTAFSSPTINPTALQAAAVIDLFDKVWSRLCKHGCP